MIVTHTLNAQGHRRVYLGGKASVECWIEPAADGIAWSFHMDTAPTAYPLPDDAMRAWAKQVLLQLAAEIGTEPDTLKAVPFECIAALHTTKPGRLWPRARPAPSSLCSCLLHDAPGDKATSRTIRFPKLLRAQFRRETAALVKNATIPAYV